MFGQYKIGVGMKSGEQAPATLPFFTWAIVLFTLTKFRHIYIVVFSSFPGHVMTVCSLWFVLIPTQLLEIRDQEHGKYLTRKQLN